MTIHLNFGPGGVRGNKGGTTKTGGTKPTEMPKGDGPGGRGQMPAGDDKPPKPMPDGDGPGGKKRGL